jgi:hypothetical protein
VTSRMVYLADPKLALHISAITGSSEGCLIRYGPGSFERGVIRTICRRAPAVFRLRGLRQVGVSQLITSELQHRGMHLQLLNRQGDNCCCWWNLLVKRTPDWIAVPTPASAEQPYSTGEGAGPSAAAQHGSVCVGRTARGANPSRDRREEHSNMLKP